MAATRAPRRRPPRAAKRAPARAGDLAAAAPPRPPSVFVGRERELGLLERGLARVPVAVVCGLAGVGKSSLAYAAAARWPGPTVHATAGRGLGALVDELRRRAGGPAADLRTDDERCAALAAILDDAGALVVIDDLHRLPAADQPRLLAAIGTRLTRGRLIATSREWPAAAQGYDRVEVHLGGLPARAARELWAALDELRGATAGFTRAFEATGGNPFLLRRRHAGDPSGPEPLAQAIAALDDDAARLLGVIALARTPLTADQAAAIALVDGKAAIAALRRALLVDLDGDRRALVHELVREAAAAALPADVRRALHGRLAAALTPARSVAATVAVVHHALAAGEPRRARDHLLARARDLLDLGASRELCELCAALPPAADDAELDAVRARALVRLLDVAAGEQLLRTALARPAPSGAVLIPLGTLALVAGRFDDARRALARAADDRGLAPLAQANRIALEAVLRFHADDAAAALAELAAAGERAPGAARALLWATATYLSWLDRYTVSAERRGTPTSDNRPPAAHGYRAAALGAFAFGGYEVAASPADSARALTVMEAALSAHRDPLSAIHREALQSLRQWEAGDRLGALAALRALAARAEEAGYVLGVLWAQVFLGRILHVLGLRGEARAVLDRTAERARALGAPVVARAALSAADDDPVTRLAMATRDDGPPSPSVRTRAFQAIAAAARGRAAAEVDVAIDARPGYHVEAALGHLAGGLAARAAGDERGWQAARTAARRALAPADPELLDALLAVVDDRAGAAAGGGGAPPTIVDRVRHELVIGPRVIALRARPVLRRLLYALVERAGQTLTKDDLTRAVWSQEYDPLRHDNPLFVNLSRLRQLVRDTGLVVEVDNERGGYRLTSRDPIVFARRR